MPLRIGMLVFPDVQQLDLTGPYEVLALLPNTEVSLVWKDRSPLVSITGLTLQPTSTFADAPQFDIMVVPGGRGINALLNDSATLAFLQQQAESSQYVTSVCTGALVLGAAGLLRGYRATTHWQSLHFLSEFGAVPVQERVVVDRNRITGGGITAGIDFGLKLAAILHSEHEAKLIQLELEYNPEPPFNAGSPESAGAELVAEALRQSAASLQVRKEAVARARQRLG